MEQVFSAEMGGAFSPNTSHAGRPASQPYKFGTIEKVLGSGKYIVVTEDGQKIEVKSSAALKTGQKVQAFMPASSKISTPVEAVESELKGAGGTRVSAFLPLAFGGDHSQARLEVFVEKRAPDKTGKEVPAIYFVFTVQTEEIGETQWSIYLKGRQLNLQVYALEDVGKKERLRNLVIQVEKSLKSRGYVLTTPTVQLKKPFKVPAGFRLNLRG